MKFTWIDGFIIESKFDGKNFIIKANREGLLSLASHLQTMANAEYINGYHFHLDESNALEDNSVPLIFERIP